MFHNDINVLQINNTYVHFFSSVNPVEFLLYELGVATVGSDNRVSTAPAYFAERTKNRDKRIGNFATSLR